MSVTINHPPFSGNICEEGLRTIVGTQMAVEEQMLNAIFIGDGVYFGLKEMNQESFAKYLKTMKSMDMAVYLEEESVRDRHIEKDMINDEFITVSRSEILRLLKESDHVLSF